MGKKGISSHVEDLSEIVAQCWSCNETHSTPIDSGNLLQETQSCRHRLATITLDDQGSPSTTLYRHLPTQAQSVKCFGRHCDKYRILYQISFRRMTGGIGPTWTHPRQQSSNLYQNDEQRIAGGTSSEHRQVRSRVSRQQRRRIVDEEIRAS